MAERSPLPADHALWGDHSHTANATRLYLVPSDCASHAALAPFSPEFLPPDSLIIPASSSIHARLPSTCQASAAPLPPHARIHPSAAALPSLSHPQELASCRGLSCPTLHPQSTPDNPLVTLDVHFARVPDTRPECLHSSRAAAPPHCRTPQHQRFATAAMHDWHETLRQRLGTDSLVMSEHRGLLRLHVRPSQLDAALEHLSAEPLVSLVTAGRVHHAHNLAAAAAVAQSPSALTANGAGGRAAGAQHPFWQAGLAGKGQLIGIGDSGLDMTHCAFADVAVPFESFGVDDFSVPIFNSSTHRKVALYYMMGDAQDDEQGHGSHVAGIAAASPQGGDSTSNRGVAYDARLAFFDLGAGQHSDAGFFAVPYDLAEDYFPRSMRAGVRVHSDSWGSNLVSYDFEAASVDKFSHANPSFLSIFSAGNYGQYRRDYQTTVNSPALAKNTVGVGNSLNADYTAPSFPSAQSPVHTLEISAAAPQAALSFTARVVQAAFSGDWGSLSKGVPVVMADPPNACSDLRNRAAAQGAAVLMLRGDCDYEQKIHTAEGAVAAAVIVGNSVDEFEVMTRNTPGAAAIPVGLVPLGVFSAVQAYIASAQPVNVRYVASVALENEPSFQSIDPSSSTGPTTDGRLKPDLVAPGTVASVRAGSGCGYEVRSGTSMAAPMVAGTAAIVRQYLAEGYYPGGTKGQGVKHDASGPLIKAILVGGAQPLTGFAGNAPVPLATPSGITGWGRVSLEYSLPLAGKSTISNMQFVDMETLSKATPEHLYCFTAAQGYTVTVTLAWHDPPAAASAKQDLLVNDLDLEMAVASLGGMKLHSRSAAVPDRVNNVERIRLEKPPAGQLVVKVRAARLMTEQQQYSLVVQGAFEGLLQSGKNPARGGNDTAGATCEITSIVITVKPDTLTADGAPAFAFSTRSGAKPSFGFECELRTSDAKDVAAVHAWQACASPKSYTGLRDGNYVFSVRLKGEPTAESHGFQVDISPPETVILPNFGYPNASVLGEALPPAQTSAQIAAFAFATKDRSNTTQTCTFRAPPGAKVTSVWRGTQDVKINEEYECTSPQVFSVTSAGAHSFEVSAKDAIGNRELTPKSHAFSVVFPPATVATHISGAPWGRTNSRNVRFQLAAVQGGANGAVTPVNTPSFQYALATYRGAPATANGTQGNQTQGSWVEAAWASVPSGSKLALQARQDGEYRIRFRAQSASVTNAPTTWRLNIDSTPPQINFTVEPPRYVSSDTVLMKVTSSEEGTTWDCALLEGDQASVDAGLLKPCPEAATGTLQYHGLGDGKRYTYAIRATDSFGNTSPIVLRKWLIDASAPALHAANFTRATRDSRVNMTFGVSDGPAGTGVKSVDCGVRWLGNGPQPQADWRECNRSKGPPLVAAGGESAAAACPDCLWYTKLIDTEDEGRWGFSVRTADKANSTFTSKEAVLVVDRTAPRAAWAAGGIPRDPSPPTFSFTLDTVDSGPYKSGIRGALCALARSHATPTTAFKKQANASVLLPETAAAGDTAQGEKFEVIEPGGATREASQGSWYVCGAPIKLQKVRSGTYTFSAKPLDEAGNVGPMLQRQITVDERLSPDQPIRVGGGRRARRTTTFAIVGVVAAALTTLLVIASVFAYRRRRKRLAAAERAAPGGVGVSTSRLGIVGSGDSGRMSSGNESRILADREAVERARMDKAIELSMLEAGLEASRRATREDTALKLAIEASLADHGRPGRR